MDRFVARLQARREAERPGERVEVILGNAEDAAAALRNDADDEARRTIVGANVKGEEILAQADRRAEALIADGIRRRRRIEQEIAELSGQRDELANRLRALAREIQLTAVQNTRVEVIDPEEGVPEKEPGEDDLEEFDDIDEIDELDELEDEDEVDEDVEPELGEMARGPRFRVSRDRGQTPS